MFNKFFKNELIFLKIRFIRKLMKNQLFTIYFKMAQFIKTQRNGANIFWRCVNFQKRYRDRVTSEGVIVEATLSFIINVPH